MFRGARRHSLVLFCLVPLLFGGTCGAVLRRYDPVGWEYGNKSSSFERRVGDLHIELTGLVRQTGRLGLALVNRGETAIELRGVDLRIDGEHELWTPGGGLVRVEPGARQELEAVFRHELRASRCQVVLMLSTGELAIDLAVP